MKKILIQIKNNRLCFSLRKRLNTEQKNLINTNVISENELVFSDEYIEANIKIVHNFVKELVNDYNVNTIVIKELEIAPLVLRVSSMIPKLQNLFILEESIVNYKTCERIIKTNTIKYVSLYNIPTFLLELLDKENIKVDSRNEILFLSNFMKDNDLNQFSSLYYKSSIVLNFPLSKEDYDDFISFININKYLKKIYVNKVSKNDIEDILEELYKKRLKNIKIYIDQNICDAELIEYLKKINKRNEKINGIQFKIEYSKDYLENNLMSQININAIKSCIIISLVLVSSVMFYVFASNYIAMGKDNVIKQEIYDTIAKKDDTTITDDKEIINDDVETEKIVKEKDPEIVKLKELNEDTVGWLKVNNTNVDYPVVQSSDPEYYLTRNFKKKKDANGWIYMDYRDDPEELSTNTIIYGHNMYYSGVMFGTLYKVKRSSWYEDKENQIIEFNNIYNKMKWQIFSIYVVKKTNDYLYTDFASKERYKEYLELVTNRSKYNFNVPVSTDDKILTLSTCSNNGNDRLVIHAVLIEEKINRIR